MRNRKNPVPTAIGNGVFDGRNSKRDVPVNTTFEPNQQGLQARRLAKVFALPITVARVIAELAFGSEGRR